MIEKLTYKEIYTACIVLVFLLNAVTLWAIVHLSGRFSALEDKLHHHSGTISLLSAAKELVQSGKGDKITISTRGGDAVSGDENAKL